MLSQDLIEEVRKKVNIESNRMPLIFNVLSDVRRFYMLRLFSLQHGLCVTDVAKIFSISLPAASRQLKILEMAGLVRSEKMGKILCYEVKSGDPIVKLLLPLIS